MSSRQPAPEGSVLLLQLPVPETAAMELTGNAPLGVAALASSARHATGGTWVELVPQDVMTRYGDAALLNWVVASKPRVLALTVTVWNVERSAWLARQLKLRLPKVQIWVGGPEVAQGSWLFSGEFPFDVAVEGEGEVVFPLLLESDGRARLPGVHHAGEPMLWQSAAPTANLDDLEDPYVSGRVRCEADGVVLLETWRGCRYRCRFCRYHQGRTGHAARKSQTAIAEVFAWARVHRVREIYLLDPSLEQRDDLHEFLDFLAGVNSTSIPLFAELRCDMVDPDLAQRLFRAGVRRVETGLQTLTPDALKAMGRSARADRFVAGVRALRAQGIDVKVDLMMGLPGDSPSQFEETLNFVLREDLARHVQLFQTQVLPGTDLMRRASHYGLEFDDRPPYLVRSTPTWSSADMEGMAGFVEGRLSTVLHELEAPVLGPFPKGATCQVPYPDCDSVLQYGFNFRQGPPEQPVDFSTSGRTAVLRFAGVELPGQGGEVRRLVADYLDANPFSSLLVCVELDDEVPLDLFDELNALMDSSRPSRYLEHMLHLARPERRVLAVLPLPLTASLPEDWVSDLAFLSEIAWSLPLEKVTDASPVGDDASGDYLLIQVPERLAGAGPNFEALSDLHPDPSRILFDHPDVQWRYIRFLEGME